MKNNKKWTIAELRKNHIPTLSQRELSLLLDIPISTIAMYETGSRTPSLGRAMKIAQFFGVSTDDIIFGQDAHKMRATGTEGK